MRTPSSTVSGRPPCWPSRCVVSVVQAVGGERRPGARSSRSAGSRRAERRRGTAPAPGDGDRGVSMTATVGPLACPSMLIDRQSMAARPTFSPPRRPPSTSASRARRSTPTSAAACVASEPGPGPSRERRYPRGGDWRRLRGRRAARSRPRAGGPRRAPLGPPVLDSALTLIEDGRLYYRGLDVCELSRRRRFEEVAALLWTGSSATRARSSPAPARPTAGRHGAGGAIAARLLAEQLDAAVARTLAALGRGRRATLRAAGRSWTGSSPPPAPAAADRWPERLARGWGRPGAPPTTCAPRSCSAPTTS